MNQHGSKSARTAIDLFAGAGGLTLGLKQAGFRVLAAVEIDCLAAQTYRHNHADVILWENDIRKISGAQILKRLQLSKGTLDLLAGCPPCQGFSQLRTLNGARKVDDERNDLIFEFLRLVEEIKPRTIMMENVTGLKSDKRMTVFGERLKELGYEWNADILDAADFGVPQRRRRLVLLGSIYGLISFGVPDSNSLKVRDAIGDLEPPSESSDKLHCVIERRSARIQRLIRRIPKDGGSRAQLGQRQQLACHRRCNGFKDIYGRMAWEKVAPTITTGVFNPSKGRFLHPEEDRCITLREAALLQTFPSDYFFSLEKGKGKAAALIGNALPPEFVRRQGTCIMHHLNSHCVSQ